jgi:hypothetical protein
VPDNSEPVPGECLPNIFVPDPQAGMCLTTVSLYLETAAFIFVPDPQAGMCLTTVSLYLETACLYICT